MTIENPVPSERIKTIFAAVVDRLKEVVREHKITQDELHAAGDYFNRLGQAGFSRSLIDVSLAMTSVDATTRVANGTRPNLEGPFHRAGSPLRADGSMFDAPPRPGTQVLTLSGAVFDSKTGSPLPGVVIDAWQADGEGHYELEGRDLSGRVLTDDQGRYRIVTAVPKDYSDHDHDPIGELFRAMGRHNRRAAHIHVKIVRDGCCVLTTQLFIPGNPYLDSDYVEGAVSDDLIIDMRPVAGEADRFEAHFDFRVVAPEAVTG